jgi:predicted aspartyl protease
VANAIDRQTALVRFRYSSRHTPPAPLLEIRLARPDEAFRGPPLEAMLDTGADATIVPRRYIDPLHAQIDSHRYLRTQWGDRRPVHTYLLDVEVAGLRLPSIEVVADRTGDEAIVGRDVLNRLRITLDGPAGTLEVTG